MKYLLAIIVAIGLTFGWAVALGFTANAATEDCWSIAVTNREETMSRQLKYAQQFTPDNNVSLESISFNIYGALADVGDFITVIQETTAGLPNGTSVAGSLQNKPSNVVPDAPIGAGQEFDCNDQPTINHTFTYPAPVLLNSGQMYALIIYHDTGAHFSQVGIVTGDDTVVPGSSGLRCSGVNCPTDVGWAIWNFSGTNVDFVYHLENSFVDPAVGSTDGKIDSHIQTLRAYTQLDGDGGGLIFSLIVMSIIFIVGIKFGIAFPVVAMFNTLLAGAFARAGIMPGWILIAVIAIAGLALVFKLANGSGNQSNEV